MLYEAFTYIVSYPFVRCCTAAGDEHLQSNIPGKLMWNGLGRNEIAFMCVCKTKELFII